jgi:DNA-binding transcriptional LysR family regulator
LPQLKAGFFQRRLLSTRYVCLMRRGHRLDKARLTLREFSAAQQVLVVSQGTGHGKVDELMRRAGVQRRVRVTVPHFMPVGHLLQASDMLATVPEPLAQRLAAPFGLVWVKHPVELPELRIHLFWHAKAHRDPASLWLRGLIFELFGTAAA